MIHVDFDPAKLTGAAAAEWAAWIARATAATAEIIKCVEKGEKPDWGRYSPIWSELKVFLLKHAFHGKCAYCETNVDAGFFGDAEHYRPKGAVKDLQNQPVHLANGKPHPGYYWLALDWRNLIPACSLCNSGEGKMNRFPARKYVGSHLEGPDVDTLDLKEEPLLLHPYRDDPLQHLVFGKNGIVAPRAGSKKGEASIRTCGLDREALRVQRHLFQRQARIALFTTIALADAGERLEVLIDRILPSTTPYSASARDYLLETVLDLIAQAGPAGAPAATG